MKKFPVGEERKEIKWHVDDEIPIIIWVDNDHPYRGISHIQIKFQQGKVFLVAYSKQPTSFTAYRDKEVLETFEKPAGKKVLDYLEGWSLESYERL